jgi:GDPmannose 4,6-dehydratase
VWFTPARSSTSAADGLLDPKLIRPAEVGHLIGDSSKAKTQLACTPSVDFTGLITMTVNADLDRVAATPQLTDRRSAL